MPRAALVLLLLLAGCTTGPRPAATPPTSDPSATVPSGPAPTVLPVPAAPEPAACYRLTGAELVRPASDTRPVPCSSAHTSRTIFVGRLAAAAGGKVAVDSPAVQKRLADTCPRKLAAYVGGSAEQRRLSRLSVVWFSPTLQQADRGADWFRCDLIAFAGTDTLFPLPRTSGGDLKGVLSRPGALDTYGLCGTAAPGAKGFARVICQQPHAWRAIATVGLRGGRPYPGVATVRQAGNATCKARARSRAGDTLSFRFGWEWPTREQWQGGQRYGYCWVPA